MTDTPDAAPPSREGQGFLGGPGSDVDSLLNQLDRAAPPPSEPTLAEQAGEWADSSATMPSDVRHLLRKLAAALRAASAEPSGGPVGWKAAYLAARHAARMALRACESDEPLDSRREQVRKIRDRWARAAAPVSEPQRESGEYLMRAAAEREQRLLSLVAHMKLHSGYRDNGRDKMTAAERGLYDSIQYDDEARGCYVAVSEPQRKGGE